MIPIVRFGFASCDNAMLKRIVTALLCVAAEDIDESSVTFALGANRGLPDPDVLVRVGPSHTNMGFLPWQIRLTEIHQLDGLRGVRWDDFFGVLRRYSKCEQRFGK